MMTPGTYIRLRRETARLSLLDVALQIDTAPHVPAHQRVDWLAAIEADRAPVSEITAFALAEVLSIDIVALSRLQAIADGAVEIDAPALCERCGAGTAPTSGAAADEAAIQALADLPAGVLRMSMRAMLRRCDQPPTWRGIITTTKMASRAGWQPDRRGDWHRPVVIVEHKA